MDNKSIKYRILWGLFLTLIMCFFIGYFHWIGKSEFMGMPIISNEQLQEITAGKHVIKIESADKWILIDGNEIPYDSCANTFYISQNPNIPMWEGQFSAVDESARLWIVQNEYIDKKQIAIEESRPFSVYIEKESFIVECTIVFTGLPVLSIRERQSILYNPYDKEIHSYSVKKINSSYTVNDSQKYTLKLWNKEWTEAQGVNLLDLGKDSEWKLQPIVRDQSALREMTAMSLWNRIGAIDEDVYCFDAKADYVELLLDNQYLGLFLLKRPQERKEMKMLENDYLYYCKEKLEEDDVETLISQGEVEIEGLKREPVFEDFTPLLKDENLINDSNYINFFLYNQLVYDAESLCRKKYVLASYSGQEQYCLYKIPSTFLYTFGLLSPKYIYYTDDVNYDVQSRVLVDNDLQGVENIDYQPVSERWKELKEKGLTVENVIWGVQNLDKYLQKSGVFERNTEFSEDECERVCEFIENRFKLMDELYG